LFISGGMGLVYPMFFGKVIDAAFTDKNLRALNYNAIILVLIFAIQAIFVFFRYYMVAWVAERVVSNLRIELYRHLSTLSQAFFHKSSTGEILSRLSDDVNRIQGVVGLDLSTFLRCTITLFGVTTILFWTNPKLTFVMLGVVPPLAVMATLWGRSIVKISRLAQNDLALATGCAQEAIAAMETVQAYTREEHEVERYSQHIESAFLLFIKRVKARALFFSMAVFITFSSIACIFWMGGRMIVSGEISPGELTQFMLYTIILAESVGAFATLWGNLSTALGATGRIFEILDKRPTVVDCHNPIKCADGLGRVEFDNVSFTYPEQKCEVVNNISFTIEPGMVCAIVGPSGSGKTTIGRLLLRHYDPQLGEIRIDGQSIRQLKLSSLRTRIAVVAQESPLFSGSVFDNIRYGHLEATDSEIVEAAKLANADTFISQMPNGYKTNVGERGVKLSGGQRQRLAIARAILRKPKILILDEATSALDRKSEGVVQDALDKVQQGITTIVIAHRLSTIRNADKVLVIQDGKLVETGNHESLMANGGMYANLVGCQAEKSDMIIRTKSHNDLPEE